MMSKLGRIIYNLKSIFCRPKIEFFQYFENEKEYHYLVDDITMHRLGYDLNDDPLETYLCLAKPTSFPAMFSGWKDICTIIYSGSTIRIFRPAWITKDNVEGFFNVAEDQQPSNRVIRDFYNFHRYVNGIAK